MFMGDYPPDVPETQGKPADKCGSSENHSAIQPEGRMASEKIVTAVEDDGRSPRRLCMAARRDGASPPRATNSDFGVAHRGGIGAVHAG